MGRKERRLALREQEAENKRLQLWLDRQTERHMKSVSEESLHELHVTSVRQNTGELMTLMCLILRQAPYHWKVDKVMRLFERIQSGIMMLNDGTYTTDQLIEDTEAWGFRLKWSVSKDDKKYFTDIFPFEELEETENDNQV